MIRTCQVIQNLRVKQHPVPARISHVAASGFGMQRKRDVSSETKHLRICSCWYVSLTLHAGAGTMPLSVEYVTKMDQCRFINEYSYSQLRKRAHWTQTLCITVVRSPPDYFAKWGEHFKWRLSIYYYNGCDSFSIDCKFSLNFTAL